MAGGSYRGPWTLGVVAAVAAVAFVGVGLLRPPGSLGDVFLEPAGAAGASPFMVLDGNANLRTGLDNTLKLSGDVMLRIGTEPGLYGGSGSDTFCDPSLIADFLEEDRAKAKAWATISGIRTDDIRGYLEDLTPVRLLADTLVTNHGFDGLSAVPRQAILQQGTVVLVDNLGVPRVRCKCGNPLAPPEFDAVDNVDLVGGIWDGFQSASVMVIQAGDEPVDEFILKNLDDEGFIARPVGTSGDQDEPVDINGTPTKDEPNDNGLEDEEADKAEPGVASIEELCQNTGPTATGSITGIADSIDVRSDPTRESLEITRIADGSPVKYFTDLTESEGSLWAQVGIDDECGWINASYLKNPDGYLAGVLTSSDYLNRVLNKLEPETMHAQTINDPPYAFDESSEIPFDNSELLRSEAKLRSLVAGHDPIAVLPSDQGDLGDTDGADPGCAFVDLYHCEYQVVDGDRNLIATVVVTQNGWGVIDLTLTPAPEPEPEQPATSGRHLVYTFEGRQAEIEASGGSTRSVDVTFTIPDDSVRCIMWPDAVECVVNARTFTPPPPTADDLCSGDDLTSGIGEWGDRISFSGVICPISGIGLTYGIHNIGPVNDGDSITFDDTRCEIATSSVVCRHSDGRGFFLSNDELRFLTG